MHKEYQLDYLENNKDEEYEECLINQFYEMKCIINKIRKMD